MTSPDDEYETEKTDTFIEFTETDRLRVVITERTDGMMTAFAILQERRVGADWVQVIRIDSDHGVVHVHHGVDTGKERVEDLWPIDKVEQLSTLYYKALTYLSERLHAEVGS